MIKVTVPYMEKQIKEAVYGTGLSMKEQHQYIRHSNEVVNNARSFGLKGMMIL